MSTRLVGLGERPRVRAPSSPTLGPLTRGRRRRQSVAGFRTHITVSGALGVVYGGVAVQPLGFTTETAFLAAGLTTVGGMLPDLDSDSGVPVREMFGLAAVVVPITMVPRMHHMGVSQEGILATLLFGYVL